VCTCRAGESLAEVAASHASSPRPPPRTAEPALRPPRRGPCARGPAAAAPAAVPHHPPQRQPPHCADGADSAGTPRRWAGSGPRARASAAGRPGPTGGPPPRRAEGRCGPAAAALAPVAAVTTYTPLSCWALQFCVASESTSVWQISLEINSPSAQRRYVHCHCQWLSGTGTMQGRSIAQGHDHRNQRHLDVWPTQDAALAAPPRAGQPRHGRLRVRSEALATVALPIPHRHLLPRRLLASWVLVPGIPRVSAFPRRRRPPRSGVSAPTAESGPAALTARVALRPAPRHPGDPAGVLVLDPYETQVDTCRAQHLSGRVGSRAEATRP